MWRLFAAIAAACIALLAWPEAVAFLRWQRGVSGAWGAFSDGECWRMLSAHFVHLGVWHALANLAGLALVIECLGAWTRPDEALAMMLVSALAIIAGLALRDPAVGWYAGLSGVVHGLWAGCALLGWLRQSRRRSESDSQGDRQGNGQGNRQADKRADKRADKPRAGARQLRFGLPAAACGVLVLKLMLPPLPWLAAASGLPVVPQSHWYGALAGAIVALALFAGSSHDAMQ